MPNRKQAAFLQERRLFCIISSTHCEYIGYHDIKVKQTEPNRVTVEGYRLLASLQEAR